MPIVGASVGTMGQHESQTLVLDLILFKNCDTFILFQNIFWILVHFNTFIPFITCTDIVIFLRNGSIGVCSPSMYL